MEVIMANNINTLVSSTNGVQSGATIVGRNNDITISNLNKASSIYSGSSRQRTTQASNESLNRTASLYSGSRRSMYDDNNNTSNSSSVTLPEPDENLFNEFMSTVAPYVKMSDEEKNYYYQISSQITANGGDASSWAQDFLSTNAIANVLGVSRSEVNQNRCQLLNYYLGIEDNKPLDFTTGATLINSINQGRRQQEEAGLQEDLINLYKRGYDDNSPEVQQIVKKILQKEQEMSYFEDSNPRMWTTEWAKNSLSQLAYMGVGTLVGTAGGIVGGLIGNTVFGPAGGVKGFQIGSGLARFLTYDKQFEASAFWNMKQAGVSTETALKYSNIDGFINGLNEAFLDVGYSQVMGGVGKLAGVADLGGKIVPTIVSRVAKDGTLAGWLGSLLLYMGLDATGEFVQESTQSLTSSALQAIAEATDGLPYSNNVRDALSSAWEEGIQGFATGLFFSGFGSGINVLADIKKTSKLKNNSIHSYSQEAYVNNQENRNLVKSLKLGGSELSEDNVTNLLKKLYDSTQKVRDDIKSGIRKDLFEQLKTIDGSLNENVLDGADITTNEIKDEDGNVISGKKTEVKRKSDGSTYFVVDKEENRTEDGKEHYTMRIANPNVVGTSRLGEIYVDAKTAEYNDELLNAVKTSPKALSMEQAGAISFTLDGETKTLTIESVNVQDDNASLKEQAIRDLMKMYSDYSIEWNNRTQSDNAVFSSIESSNPRNTSTNTYGLNYTDNSKTTEEQSDRAYVRRWLGTSFSEDASENDFMATILQGAAKARGLSGQEFIEKYFTEIRESENKDANVKGYTRTSRDELSKQVKATIYAGKSADPTTFLHELNHAIILMGDNRKEFTSIFNKVKGTKQFMSFVKSNMDILRYVIGKTDDKGVYVLENGKYVVDEAKLQTLFQDANNWTRDDFEFEARLYEAYMRSGQTLNPTLTGFFRRVAETFRRVYTALRNGISSSNLNDEIVAYFDKLYGYDPSTGTTSILNDSGELHDIGELRQQNGRSIQEIVKEALEKEPIVITDADLPINLSFGNIKDTKNKVEKYALANLRGVYTNDESNSSIEVQRRSIKETLNHDTGKDNPLLEAHIKAVFIIPEIIKTSKFLGTEQNQNPNTNVKQFDYYINSIRVNDEDYIVRSTVSITNMGNVYYDQKLTNKGSLRALLNKTPGFSLSTSSDIKDKRLLSFLQGTNNSSTLTQTQDDISNLSAIEQYDAIKKQYYGTDKYMIAPNGKATKLTEEQWIQVRTPNFIKWFGDWINDPDNASKVVDENGEPLPVFHGTPNANFDIFNEKRRGIYFTSDVENANSYAITKNGGTYSVFLKMTNPLTIDAEGSKWSSIRFKEEKDYRKLLNTKNITPSDLATYVGSNTDYDGVFIKNVLDGTTAADDYIVFNSTQIKSSTDNNGEFSSNIDSILYQEAYHGSGSLFEAFNKEFINTGTQAQDYGYGFYFSNEEEVAEGYAHALTRTQENINEDISFLEKRIDSLKASIKGLKNEISNLEDTDSERYKEAYNEEYAKTEKGIQRYKDNPNSFFLKRYAIVESIESFVKDKLAKNIERQKNQLAEKENALSNAESELNNLKNEKPREGHLYKVNIPDKGFISWDKTISQSLWNRIINEFNSQYPDKKLGVGITTGEVLNQYLTKALGSQKEATDFLSGLGIVGYKYSITDPFGKLSKAEKRATNYVVFDDKNITDVSALFQTEVEDAQQELAKKFSKSFVLGSNKQFATESEEQAIKEIVYNYPKKHVIDGVYMLKGLLDDKHDLPMKKEFLTSRLVNIITGKDMILLPRFMDRMLNAIIGEQRFDNYSLSDGISAVSTDGKTFEFKLVKNQKNAVTKLNDALKKADVGVVILSSKGSLDRFDKAKISKKGEALVINIYDAKNIEVLKKTTSNEWRLVRPDSKSELKLNNLSSIESIASELQKIKPENQDKMDYAIYSAENEQEVKEIERKNLEQNTQSDLSDKLMQLAYHGSPNEIIGELSTKYMGSGEGHQIHGWGLYFAQDQNISKERYISRLAERKDEDILSFDGKEITIEDYYGAFPFMATKEFHPYWKESLNKSLHEDTERKELITRERAQAKEELKKEKHSVSLIETILANPSSKEALEARKKIDFVPSGDISEGAIKTLKLALDGHRELVAYYEKGLDLLKRIEKNPEKLKISNPSRPSLFINGEEISSYTGSEIEAIYGIIIGYSLENNLVKKHEGEVSFSSGLNRKLEDKYYQEYFKSVFDKGELVPLVEKILESGNFVDEAKILDVAKSIKSVEVNAPVFGSLLTVDIPENEVLLDEQKRFNNQSEFVQKALKRLYANEFGIEPKEDWRGDGIYSNIQAQIAKKTQSYDDLPKQASLMLAKYGVEGITYVGETDGRCFVIFTDEAIKKVDSRLYQIGDSEWTETAKRIAYEASSLEDFFKKYREQVEDGNIELDNANVSQLLTSIYDEAESEAYDPTIEGYFDEEESSLIDEDWAVEEVERPLDEESMASSSTTTSMSDEVPDWFDLTEEEIASLNKDAETTETNTQELEKNISEVQKVVVDADLPKGLSLDHSRSLDTSSHARAIEFANILKGSKEATIEFLKTLREVNNEFFYNNGAEYNEAVNEESYQAKTIRESAFNNFKNMSKFIQNLVYESKGSQYRNLDKITDRAWKIVAGQVSANPDVYMDLYSRASGNTEWSGENSIEARVLSEIGLTERDWNDLSYSKRKEYIQYIEDKDIRKRILTGDVKDVDLRGYIERTEKRAEASLSEAKALEESQKYIIDENKKTILKLGTEAQNYQKQLAEIEKEKAEIQEKLERNVKSMENKLKNSNMDTSNTLVHADLLKKMTELNRREAQYQKALKMWQKGSTTVTQEDLTRIKGLIEDARAKIEELQNAEEITPEEAIKRLQNLYNAWKDAKTKETIDKLKDKYNVRLTNLRQTKNEAIVETRKRYMQIMKERETLRRIRSEKERLIKQIMKAPSANIAREEARQIKALQLLIDPAFRRGTIKALDGKVYTVAELKAMLTKNSDDPVIQTLTERQIERLTKTSLDEMTLSEVEDTYRYIKSLREEGLNKRRSEIIQRKAETQIIYNELTNALMESKNFADYGFEGTEDKKARLNTKSGKVRNAWYQTLNMARKAQILDNNEKGTFYNLLIRKKRTLQAEEMKALSKRANLIQDTIKANNIDTDSLYKTWTMNLEDGRTVTFTTSELAYIYLSQYCQENREALAYGTFVSIDEKSTFQKSADSVIIGQGKSLIEARENKVNDDIRRLGDWRYNEALSLAKTVIEGDKGIYNLVKAIESDLNSSDFQRVIDLTRKIYNVDIKKEDYYLPLNRTDFLGKDPGEDIKNDLLNTVPGTRGVVDKGFTKERNKTISPLHQKAIKYDLFKVWTESVKKQEHFIAMQEYINQLNSLFVDGDKAKLLRSRIENTYGKTMLENLDEYIKEVANPDAGALQQDPAKDILNAAKGNIYAAYLGFKLSSITNQLITSPAAFLGKVSPIRLASNLLQMIVHYKDISEKVFELSPFMKSRNFDLIAGEIKESAENLGLSKAQRGWNKVLEFGLKGLEFADQFSVVAGWKAIFDQELERLGGETEENIRTASAIADEYVYETQPLSDKSEIAPLFKNKSAFTNIMLQFQTSLNVVWNNLAYDTVQDFRKKNWRKAVGTVVGYAMAGSLLALAHGEFKPDDDDDEDEKLKKFWMKFGYSVLSQGVESIPIFSNVVDPIFKYIVTDEKPSYTSNMITPFPFIANASEATKYTVQAIREKDTEALTKALDKGADAFMLALGLPYSGLRELQAIQDVGIQALLGERK